MLRQALEAKNIHLSDSEFAIICEIVTDDLKFNRISFEKCSNLDYVVGVAEKTAIVLKRCA